jgi:hypothetical protein
MGAVTNISLSALNAQRRAHASMVRHGDAWHGAAQSSLRRLRKLVCARAFAHPTDHR